MDLKPYMIKSIQAAIVAGKAINTVYHSEDFGVEYKADTSPLTVADQKSHEIIMNMLQDVGIPILSEEGLNKAARYLPALAPEARVFTLPPCADIETPARVTVIDPSAGSVRLEAGTVIASEAPGLGAQIGD